MLPSRRRCKGRRGEQGVTAGRLRPIRKLATISPVRSQVVVVEEEEVRRSGRRRRSEVEKFQLETYLVLRARLESKSSGRDRNLQTEPELDQDREPVAEKIQQLDLK